MELDPNAVNTDPVAVVPAPIVKPESWEDEVWNDLVHVEQKAVHALHAIGIVFAADVWPVLKATLGLFFSQLGKAAFAAITATIADPALMPSAVGAALMVTASTTGVADAKLALANAEAAIENDPAVQAILNPAG